MAIWRRGKPDSLPHHTDQGSQYTSGQFQRPMADHGITRSMSRSGNVDATVELIQIQPQNSKPPSRPTSMLSTPTRSPSDRQSLLPTFSRRSSGSASQP